jgi:hypothetical protein
MHPSCASLLVLPTNVRLDWKVFDGCKHSSLFGVVIINEEKKFFNIDSRHQVYKNFFFFKRSEQVFVIIRLFQYRPMSVRLG